MAARSLLSSRLPFLTLYGAVAVAVWFGGWEAGCLATIIGFFLTDYLFFAPRGMIVFRHAEVWIGLIGYGLSCSLIIGLGEAMRRAQFRAETETQQRRIKEEALRAKQSELQDVINSTPFMLTRCSRDLRYLFVSQTYAANIGRKPEEVAGKLIREVMGEAGFAVISPYIEQVRRGERVEYERDVDFIGRGWRKLHVIYTPDRNSAGEVIGWFASITDLTEREQAKGALRQSAQQQEAMYRFASDLQQTKTSVEIYDAAVEAIIGGLACDRASILLFDNQNVMRFVASRGLSEGYRRNVEGHSPWTPETRTPQPITIENVETADLGEPLKTTILNEGIRACAFIPLISNGRVIGKFMSYFNQPHVFGAAKLETGVTLARQLTFAIDRQRAEEKLRESDRQTTADLQAAMRLFEVGEKCSDVGSDFDECLTAILDAAIAIMRADRGNIQLIEAESGALKIARQRGFDEPFIRFFSSVDGDKAAACAKALALKERFIVENVNQSDVFAGTDSLPVLLEAGVQAVQSTPLLSSHGRILGVISTHFSAPHRPNDRELRFIDLLARQAADYLERRRVEEALQSAKSQAEDANRAKDQFLAMLSHELRTPLTPGLMAASALVEDPNLPSGAREQLTMMRRNIELEARLIDDLLDITRIANGKLDLQSELVDVHAALEQALIISASGINAKRLHLIRRFAATNHFCRADAARLQEVFWNILRNAVKFTPANGHIGLYTFNDAQQVVVEINDNGIGIEPEIQARIFEAFAQGEPAMRARFGGLGLGLAISKRIIELHGGSIEVRSGGRDQGSTFVIRLTCAERIRGEAPSQPMIALAPTAAAQILIVEDHEDTIHVLTRILRSAGYAVTPCTTLGEARLAAASQKFDLLISDLGLPDGSGLDLMRHLRQTQQLTGIALSGFGAGADLEESKAAGFSVHLTKPVDVSRLRFAIGNLLGVSLTETEVAIVPS